MVQNCLHLEVIVKALPSSLSQVSPLMLFSFSQSPSSSKVKSAENTDEQDIMELLHTKNKANKLPSSYILKHNKLYQMYLFTAMYTFYTNT